MIGRVLCEMCAEKHDTQQTLKRKQWREEGKCGRCGAELPNGEKGRMCDKCREYTARFREANRQQAKERRERLRAKGMCTRCGEMTADAGHVTCWKCRARHKAEIKRNDPDNAKKYARRQERIEQGLCIDCGRKAEHGKMRCFICNRKQAESQQVYRIKKKIQKSAEMIIAQNRKGTKNNGIIF